MATHSSVLAWGIPGMEEPGGLPSMGSHSQTWLKWLSSSSKYGLNSILKLILKIWNSLKIGRWCLIMMPNASNIGARGHAQSCPALCSSMDCSPLGSSVILVRCCKTYNDLFHSWAVSQSSQMISPRKGSKGQEHKWNFCFQVRCDSHLSNFILNLSIQCFSRLCSTQKTSLLRYPKCNRTSLPKTEF